MGVCHSNNSINDRNVSNSNTVHVKINSSAAKYSITPSNPINGLPQQSLNNNNTHNNYNHIKKLEIATNKLLLITDKNDNNGLNSVSLPSKTNTHFISHTNDQHTSRNINTASNTNTTNTPLSLTPINASRTINHAFVLSSNMDNNKINNNGDLRSLSSKHYKKTKNNIYHNNLLVIPKHNNYNTNSNNSENHNNTRVRPSSANIITNNKCNQINHIHTDQLILPLKKQNNNIIHSHYDDNKCTATITTPTATNNSDNTISQNASNECNSMNQINSCSAQSKHDLTILNNPRSNSSNSNSNTDSANTSLSSFDGISPLSPIHEGTINFFNSLQSMATGLGLGIEFEQLTIPKFCYPPHLAPPRNPNNNHSNNLNNIRPCAKLICNICKYEAISIDNVSFNSKCNSVTIKHAYPHVSLLKQLLIPAAGYRAYCCACQFAAVNITTPCSNNTLDCNNNTINPPFWYCAGHD